MVGTHQIPSGYRGILLKKPATNFTPCNTLGAKLFQRFLPPLSFASRALSLFQHSLAP